MDQQTLPGARHHTNTILLFFIWLFYESTMHAVAAWLFFVRTVLRLFSVPLLVRTFVDPWHRYWYGYPKQLDFAMIFQAFFGNLMSRVIGMILRTFFIIMGCAIAVVVGAIGAACIMFWMVLPFVSLFFIYMGFMLIF
ncbi:MAG: hypothetical protein AAB581_03785 [Patescibacteria group bacterium]